MITAERKKKMKTSIVMATYNGSRFIQEQLESIINQTVLPDEIVISDDGSTDSTVELVRSFFEQHSNLPIQYQLIMNDPNNRGVRGNFQNAVNHSNGEYVFFCDQDDIWFPNKIECLVSVLDSHKEKVVIHDAQILMELDDGTFYPIDKHLTDKYPFNSDGLYKINGLNQVRLAFYCGCITAGMCSCIKRDYLMSFSPFSKASYHDDWIQFCALADDTVLAIKDVLVYYRIHKNNTCGIPEFKKKRSLWEKIKHFDYKGKESIRHQYLWYTDTSSYLRNQNILDDKIKHLISFFSSKRVDAISKNKVSAILELAKEYRNGAYEIDGPIVFFHDIAFVLMHPRIERKQYIEFLKKQTRS